MRTQNDVNESNKNALQGNTGTTQLAACTTSKTSVSYSTSAARLLLEQMERLNEMEATAENTLSMVACARAIADLIRANAATKKL